MPIICPMPPVWARTHLALKRAWEELGERGDPPPIPMILSGWNFSNDVQKAERWREFVKWAQDRGLSELLPTPGSDAFYAVVHPTSFDIGPAGGPCYLPWNWTARERPSDEVLADALTHIRARWPDVVGSLIGNASRPERFTGMKRRALLVTVDANVTPPWGSWNAITPAGDARAFTRFRAAINDVIAPHHVDHVNFRNRSS